MSYELATEVIKTVCNDPHSDRDTPVPGTGLVKGFVDEVYRRWPPGNGGVGHAHARTRAAVLQEIRDFYAPRDWCPEPNVDSAIRE